MSEERRAFVPGAGFHWLTPLYDPLVALTCRDRAVKARLSASAGIRTGQRVLDLGCGTGTLVVRVKGECPDADMTGFAADSRMLQRAAVKAERNGLPVTFVQGFAETLPYPAGAFDRVGVEPVPRNSAARRADEHSRPRERSAVGNDPSGRVL